jgi:hypothetical protein
MPPTFQTDAPDLQSAYAAALTGLAANGRRLNGYADPTLIEGAEYTGCWLECAPYEGLVYSAVDPATTPAIGRANHDVFFHFQKGDGQLPCSVKPAKLGWAQIQMVVPIAASALELSARLKDQRFLETAYAAAGRWDDWLVAHRNTRGTGLCELFCVYDTGHDNSTRFPPEVPHACPDGDATKCMQVAGLPWVAPDLSATLFGGRVALAAMARLLGKGGEADRWTERADQVRRSIMDHLYDPRDLFFYDRDVNDKPIRVRGDVITRVLSEHLVDQPTFDRIYAAHIRDPKRFWTPYPLPSISADDPKFVHNPPRNSWAGSSQALTALRAPRWFEHYGRPADLAHVMSQWVSALVAGHAFRQQLDPWTGVETGADGYSPAMLCMVDFTARLFGVHADPGSDELRWNCRLPTGATTAEYTAAVDDVPVRLTTTAAGSTLRVSGREVLRVTGTGRIVTDRAGVARRVDGTAAGPQTITLAAPSQSVISFAVTPDARLLVGR